MKWFYLVFLGTISSMLTTASLAEVPKVPGWTLVWHDEFTGTIVDASAWEVLHLRNSHNDEKQFYLAEQASIAHGFLRITATDEPLEGKPYRAARLWTHKGWTYGRFEAKAKLPATQGMWPAIWLLPRDMPWPTGGEIDIMENRGSEPHQVSSAFHWGKSVADHQYVSQHHLPLDSAGAPVSFHDHFHTYAVEWEPDVIRFYVDGLLHFTVTEKEAPIPHTPMSVVLNLAVGGKFGGDPDATTTFPQELSIDYVRVWQRSDHFPSQCDEDSNEQK